MKTPPSRLLNAARRISIPRPGTARIASNAPRMSSRGAVSSWRSGAVSAIRIVSRWTSAPMVSASEPYSAHPIPRLPMTRPLKTDVIANETPVTVPTIPLARSRRSSGTSSVTHVDSAMPRICPATEPSSVSATSIQNHGLRIRSTWSASTARNRTVAAAKHDADSGRRDDHREVLAVVVDERAERWSEERRRQAEGAADDARRHDRAGLEVHPERQREPEERARDAADQRVDQQLAERVLVGSGRGVRHDRTVPLVVERCCDVVSGHDRAHCSLRGVSSDGRPDARGVWNSSRPGT